MRMTLNVESPGWEDTAARTGRRYITDGYADREKTGRRHFVTYVAKTVEGVEHVINVFGDRRHVRVYESKRADLAALAGGPDGPGDVGDGGGPAGT